MEIIKPTGNREPDHDMGAAIMAEAFKRGLSMNIVKMPGMGGVFRIAPPLTISADELDQGVSIIGDAIKAVSSRAAT